jgi:hypothetical protein
VEKVVFIQIAPGAYANSRPRKTPDSHSTYGILVEWLYAFTNDVETQEEFELSQNLLWEYLRKEETKQSLGKAFVKEFESWLRKSFYPPKFSQGLLFYHRIKVRDFDLRTSSHAEVEGGAH